MWQASRLGLTLTCRTFAATILSLEPNFWATLVSCIDGRRFGMRCCSHHPSSLSLVPSFERSLTVPFGCCGRFHLDSSHLTVSLNFPGWFPLDVIDGFICTFIDGFIRTFIDGFIWTSIHGFIWTSLHGFIWTPFDGFIWTSIGGFLRAHPFGRFRQRTVSRRAWPFVPTTRTRLSGRRSLPTFRWERPSFLFFGPLFRG